MIQLKFIGAAQTVTGSKHLIQTSKAQVLLDCGLFQGHRKEAAEKNKNLPLDAKKLNAVILSHAHIDHSGALPNLYKAGFRGPIYTTPATRELCLPMLMDTANIMEGDAEHILKLISRGVKRLDAVEPLYNSNDVTLAMNLMKGIAYHKKQEVAPGITVTFIDAGHVLGSAISCLDIEDSGRQVRLAFTGDLGRRYLPILRDPEIPSRVDYLITETTYGDRLHDPIELTTEAFCSVINRTFERRGKIIIPSFALERAQEVIYALKKLFDQKRIPSMPVYVDSPLTVKLTEIFKRHPECYNVETYRMLQGENSPFEFQQLKYISTPEQSKMISASNEPCIVISASGMCEGGRVLHHLVATIEDAKNTVLIVGFQAENTLGRRIVEKRPEVKIYGAMRKLNAEVVVLNGFSGHADQNGLLKFAEAVNKQGALKKIFLVHGEPAPQEVFKAKLAEIGISQVNIPSAGTTVEL